jgi:type IV secretory pathway TraG/TraD family ATPase VirD4
MHDITDAAEASRTILLALNREWIRKQGDFFVESAINFTTALIWYLRKYNDGAYCTLPHVIELMQVPNEKLFSILRTEGEVCALINPFITAYEAGVMEQVEGQVAAAKIALARLSSPQLYYVLSGNDFTLDINNESAPKVLCMGNNPQKTQVYGAVLSLYLSRLIKAVNQKGGIPSSLVLDEFATVFLNGIDHLIATARSNKVATTLAIQDGSQLRKDYGREQADVILNIVGNVIAGQVMGETAKQLSERFGKILQERTSLSTNSTDTSVSTSRQLEMAIPPSTIATLSSGAFVGMVADNVDQVVPLKIFHGRILQREKEPKIYQELPVIKEVNQPMISSQYTQVKKDIELLVQREIQLLIRKPDDVDLFNKN